MVEIMKIMEFPFKRSQECTAELTKAGDCQPIPLPETPGHSRACPVSFFRGYSSFLLDPGAHKVLSVPSKSLFLQSCVSSDGSIVGSMATSSKKAYAIWRSPAPRAPASGHH